MSKVLALDLDLDPHQLDKANKTKNFDGLFK